MEYLSKDEKSNLLEGYWDFTHNFLALEEYRQKRAHYLLIYRAFMSGFRNGSDCNAATPAELLDAQRKANEYTTITTREEI